MARRHWEFDLEDGHHVVDFVHGYFFGKRAFTVDGATTTQRGMPLTNHSGEYRFPFGTHDARVRITTNGFKYFYDLVVDGREVTAGQVAGTIARPRVGGPASQRLLGGILSALVLVCLPLLAIGWYDEYRYHTESATTVASVQSKRVVSGRYSDSYRLTYTYEDRRGQTHTDSDDVPRARYDETRFGSRYAVDYLLDDPSMSRFSGNDDVMPIAGLSALAVVGLAFGIYLFVIGSRRLSAIKRIGAVGQPVTATVTKLKKGQLQRVGKTITIEYEYDDPYGRRRRGRGPLMYPAEAARYAVGGSVRVLIDPDRPGESVLP